MHYPKSGTPVSTLKADFHLHSLCSDGIYTPSSLVKKAHDAGITHMALTDHETLFGLEEARLAAENYGIAFVPGVEINTSAESQIHMLLYFVHAGMVGLVSTLTAIKEDRQQRGERFLQKFNDLGYPLVMDDLQIPEGTYCSRPLVARALVRKRIVASMDEAFHNFLDVGRPAYVPRLRIETLELIALATQEGAVPVLAHPEIIRSPLLKSEDRIKELAHAGLKGIEAYHSKHSPAACKHWDEMARKFGLLVTGGSDFHEPYDSHGPIGCHTQNWDRMREDTLALMALDTR